MTCTRCQSTAAAPLVDLQMLAYSDAICRLPHLSLGFRPAAFLPLCGQRTCRRLYNAVVLSIHPRHGWSSRRSVITRAS